MSVMSLRATSDRSYALSPLPISESHNGSNPDCSVYRSAPRVLPTAVCDPPSEKSEYDWPLRTAASWLR
jgi:hypothetical protein